MVVLIDMDEVMDDLLHPWVGYLNAKYGTDVWVMEITDWDLTKFFPSLTPKQIYEPLHSEEFWHKVGPKGEAIKYVKQIFSDGDEIYVVSASDFSTIQYKYDAIIARYFPYIKQDHVILTYKKQLIKGDVLIDDGVHNLEGGSYHKILMSAPHNADYDADANGMIRANSWEEAYKALQDIKERGKLH